MPHSQPDGVINRPVAILVGVLLLVPGAASLVGQAPSLRNPSGHFDPRCADYKPWSLMQINAVVPDDADSGDQPVVLTVGQQDNSAQRGKVRIQ